MALQDNLRESWEKLSDRERRMLSIMGGVAALMIVFIAVWSTSSALAEVEEECDAIRKALVQIDRSADELARRDAERARVEALYKNTPPPLAAFLESKAKEEGLETRQVVEQPTKDVDGYKRQNVRISFNGVGLRPVMRFLSNISSERMPLAVERIQIEHYQAGSDSYNVQVGVVAFEAPAKSAKKDKKAADKAAGPTGDDAEGDAP